MRYEWRSAGYHPDQKLQRHVIHQCAGELFHQWRCAGHGTGTCHRCEFNTRLYVFTATANLLQNTDYRFDLWVKAPADNYAANDSVLNYNFHTSPVISSFPYLEGFEGNDGSWYTKGSNSSWQWGTPAKTVINNAANGTRPG